MIQDTIMSFIEGESQASQMSLKVVMFTKPKASPMLICAKKNLQKKLISITSAHVYCRKVTIEIQREKSKVTLTQYSKLLEDHDKDQMFHPYIPPNPAIFLFLKYPMSRMIGMLS